MRGTCAEKMFELHASRQYYFRLKSVPV